MCLTPEENVMSLRTITIASLALVAGTTLANAGSGDQWRRKAIDTEQWRQTQQIEQGRYQGQLTRREYRRLLVEQARVRELEQAASRDGRISRREFRDIRAAQATAQADIASDTTNGRKSFWRRFLYLTRH
jgi:hypothetical protein